LRRKKEEFLWRCCRILQGVFFSPLRRIKQPANFVGKSAKGVILLEKHSQKPKNPLHGGAALCLSALLIFPFLSGTASAENLNGSLAEAQRLIPVGHTVGMKLFARGILIIGLSEGDTPAKRGGLRKGDVVLRCGGESVDSTEQFQSLLQKTGGSEIEVEIQRGGISKKLNLKPVKNESGTYTIGAWIRDSMAGIGTMTFCDPETGTFGALGHGITDPDTGMLMPFARGSILPSAVKAVKPGEKGAAGELRGDFKLDTDLGELTANTDGGVFGVLNPAVGFARDTAALPVAENDEVKTGKATIFANVRGEEVREFDVEITKILSRDSDGRNLLITVTDPELLRMTGGIVQGMSGSPILQNGRIVGAVTHVLVNDPTRGYGILIRNMLENADAGFAEKVS
jgi:stage IV sporulation protein B